MNKILPIHRSGLITYRKCKRKWFLQYAATPEQVNSDIAPPPNFLGGIRHKRISMALGTGSAVHLGLEHLLKITIANNAIPNNEDIYAAMDIAGAYIEEEAKGGFQGTDPTFWEFYKKEQYYLSRALVFVFGHRVLPAILQSAYFTSAERELTQSLGDNLLLQGRTDGEGSSWEDIENTSPILFSWKTCGVYTDATARSAHYDDQGLSEGWLHIQNTSNQSSPHRRIWMVYLIKGMRRKDSNGLKQHSNVLIRPYATPDGIPHWDYANGKGGRKPRSIWQLDNIAPDQWLEQILQDSPETLDKYWNTPGMVTRYGDDMEEWIVGAKADMAEAFDRASQVKNLSDPLLPILLPKSRSSCYDWSIPCEYADNICNIHNTEPMLDGTFVYRQPHHELEEEDTEE